VAREIVLRQLSFAARTRAQLLTALQRAGIEDELAEAVLDRYAELDLVNDEVFAQDWVTSRHGSKGLSKRALVHELRRKGVEDEVVRAAVDTVSPDDELAAARRLARQRLASSREADQVRLARRVVGALARKGYPPGLAWAAVKDVLREQAEQAGDELDDEALEAGVLAGADLDAAPVDPGEDG
jgi:regulatory protein